MSIGKSLAWMGFAQVAAILSQFGAQIVLVRYLTLHEAGIYAIAFAVVGVLSLIQTLGLQALIVREEQLTPALSRTAFTVNAAICILLSVAIVLAAIGGTRMFGDPGVREVLLALALTPLFAIFSFLPAAILERENHFREIALSGLAGSFAGAFTLIVCAVEGFRYMSAAYAQWANLGASTIVIVALGRRHCRYALGLSAWRRVTEFGAQMLAVNGISALGLRLSDVLLGRILGLSALGLYSRASGLNGLIWANVHLLIGRVLLVDFAELRRQKISLRERYMATVDIVTVLLWPIFAGFAIIAAPFIQIVYGSKWVPAALPLALLAVASMTQVAITMTWELFTVTGRLSTQTRIEFIRSFLALAFFIGGCLISVEAAAAARVAEALFAVFLYRPYLNAMTDTSSRDLVPIYRRNLLLCAAAIGPTALYMAVNGWSPLVPLLPLGGSIALGMVAWLGLLAMTRHPLLHEVRRILRARHRGV